MKVNDVLKAKAIGDVFTINPAATVRELLAALAEHNIGAVVVSGDGTAVQGIVSERDVVRRLASDETILGAPVSQIMTTSVRTVEPHEALDSLMSLMTEHRFRHVPVVGPDGSLVGVVSIGDVVKHKIGELEFERDQLDSYVRRS